MFRCVAALGCPLPASAPRGAWAAPHSPAGDRRETRADPYDVERQRNPTPATNLADPCGLPDDAGRARRRHVAGTDVFTGGDVSRLSCDSMDETSRATLRPAIPWTQPRIGRCDMTKAAWTVVSARASGSIPCTPSRSGSTTNRSPPRSTSTATYAPPTAPHNSPHSTPSSPEQPKPPRPTAAVNGNKTADASTGT
jgi:hypothetical protein